MMAVGADVARPILGPLYWSRQSSSSSSRVCVCALVARPLLGHRSPGHLAFSAQSHCA